MDPRADLDGYGKFGNYRDLIHGPSSPQQVVTPTEPFRKPGVILMPIFFLNIRMTYPLAVRLNIAFLMPVLFLLHRNYVSISSISRETCLRVYINDPCNRTAVTSGLYVGKRLPVFLCTCDRCEHMWDSQVLLTVVCHIPHSCYVCFCARGEGGWA